MFWQGAAHMDSTSIQVGVVDDASQLVLEGVWFSDDAQAHVVDDSAVPHYSGNGDRP